MGRGDESWHDDVGVTGDRAMPERIGSLPRQNSFDLRKFEGEEIGDLLGSEVVLREGEDRFDLILPDSLLNSLLNPLLNSQLDSFLDSFLDPDLFEPFRGGELPGALVSGASIDDGVVHKDPFLSHCRARTLSTSGSSRERRSAICWGVKLCFERERIVLI